jgi:hypothetical protein
MAPSAGHAAATAAAAAELQDMFTLLKMQVSWQHIVRQSFIGIC